MNIHEYQAKEVLREFNVKTLKGIACDTVDEAVSAADKMGGSLWVVKAQIHAGGRGKGGGVKIAKSKEEVKEHASNILGMQLVTHQTGPEGKKVNKLFVEEGCDIKKEYYVACLVDRATGRATMMASSEGGMDIEEVADKTPEKIHTVDIFPETGLAPFQARQLAFKIGMRGKAINAAVKSFIGLYNTFVAKDAAMVEINPLVETNDGDVIALDAKMNFDSNALYRQPQIVEYRDLTEEDPAEVEASKYDLAFIKLDGNIGCLVNGAGLAMSTMDVIKLHGGEPANFLDVGGGATKEKVTAAFKIILEDPSVKAILVNIFGGIMKCDIIAEGVIAASKELGLKVPLVVRLEGTNVEKGKELLANSGLDIVPANDLTDAAEKAVSAAKGA
ncbi:MAG: ADP-forming succinate--CoA ligase subunit beta [Bdellovibrionaceae bacterium]|nr:ADP-forming succinate--CoA ligase subunit beta [Pseudobdellovibrionaceae bacterium]|tara:strand:- start:39236 stop:40402 length:1167 start_codon:yes stop_codon:yes gene_type:complete